MISLIVLFLIAIAISVPFHKLSSSLHGLSFYTIGASWLLCDHYIDTGMMWLPMNGRTTCWLTPHNTTQSLRKHYKHSLFPPTNNKRQIIHLPTTEHWHRIIPISYALWHVSAQATVLLVFQLHFPLSFSSRIQYCSGVHAQTLSLLHKVDCVVCKVVWKIGILWRTCHVSRW